MPIDESVTRCVAFVKDERTNQRVGTAFFVVFDGAHGYAVTAGHVAQVLNEPSVLLDVRNVGGELETVRLTSEWRFGEPSDLAVAEVGDEGLDLVGWPMEKTTDELDAIPTLGSTVFYVGLLDPIESLVARSVPMVRSGTLGAWSQSGVEVKLDKWPHKFRAHLLDVRSRAGFSGSPVFSQSIWTGPLTRTVERIQSDFPEGDYGSLFYGHALFGMFVGHEPKTETGIVVPIEDIRKALMADDLIWREQKPMRRKRNGGNAPTCKRCR